MAVPQRSGDMTTLIYGFDPLCGWCFGVVPAVRAVRDAFPDLPIRLVMSGLVSGSRVGPYAEAEEYIRGAAKSLERVTGRAPSEAFFRLISTPGVRGDSGPPCAAILHVAGLAPGHEVAFAHAVIEAHFEDGKDLNDPATYPPLMAALGMDLPPPDLENMAPVERAWAEGRAIGIDRFPTFALVRDGHVKGMETRYDPAALVDQIRDSL